MIAVAVAALGWLVLAPRDRSRREILANVSHGFGDPMVVDSKRSASGGLAGSVRRLTPAGVITRLDRQLSLAGRPPAWSMDRILLAKLVLPCVAAVLGLLFLSNGLTPGQLVLAGTVLAVSHFIPDLLLKSKGQERQTKIGLELPQDGDQRGHHFRHSGPDDHPSTGRAGSVAAVSHFLGTGTGHAGGAVCPTCSEAVW